MSKSKVKGLGFLGKEEVKIPVGGVLTPDLIGQWYAGVAYSVLAEIDKAVVESEGIDTLLITGNGPWYRYFFETYDQCQAAIEKLGIEGYKGGLRRPDQEWRFESPADKLLNMSRDDAPFGDPAVFSLRVMTMRSKKYRHELHMVSLPMAVAAAADAMGYDNPGFDLNELLDGDTVFTDEFQAEMIGDPESGDYTDSALWKRRAALWAALGEDNPLNYQPKSRDTRFDTDSDQLSNCLDILARKWAEPVWGRLLLVPDPRVDAVFTSSSGDTRRLSIPALADIYPDEATAQAAADEHMTVESTQGPKAAAGGPVIPDAYTDYPDLFGEAVDRFKAKGLTGPPPVIVKAITEEADFQGCDAKVVMAWL